MAELGERVVLPNRRPPPSPRPSPGTGHGEAELGSPRELEPELLKQRVAEVPRELAALAVVVVGLGPPPQLLALALALGLMRG